MSYWEGGEKAMKRKSWDYKKKSFADYLLICWYDRSDINPWGGGAVFPETLSTGEHRSSAYRIMSFWWFRQVKLVIKKSAAPI